MDKKIKKDEPLDTIVPKNFDRSKKISLPCYEDVPKVKGIFRNIEYPGTGISFPFRKGWKGPIKNFTFFDGLEYEVPITLAEHLNNNCAYKTLKWVSSDGIESTAKPVGPATMPNYAQKVGKVKNRFMFQITG